MKPFKKTYLTFATLTILGLTSSWISSCTDSTAATDLNNASHTEIMTTLKRIESEGGGTGNDVNGNVTTMAKLVEFLALEIGKMSDRIGVMADRIVETEKLIVYVITNQTGEAQKVIAQANTATTKNGTPISIFSGKNLTQNPIDPTSINSIFDKLLAHSGGAAANVALITPANTAVGATAGTAPSIKVLGVNKPPTNYFLVASLNATFVNPVQVEIDSRPAAMGTVKNLGIAWRDTVVPNLNPKAGNAVYIAIKNLNITSGAISSISNSVTFTYN